MPQTMKTNHKRTMPTDGVAMHCWDDVLFGRCIVIVETLQCNVSTR